MKLNEKTVIKGNSVLLVPYEMYHVPKYHNWMKSTELQDLTASEPLTLEEEYEMQKKWRIDSDIKYLCTFIILNKTVYEESKDEIKAMIGDTNIFLSNDNDDVIGEIEIMIAEKSFRGKGLGKEALLLMLRYGIQNLGIKRYDAKIGMNNDISVSMFLKSGFTKVCENKIFKEFTLSKPVTQSWIEWLECQTKFYIETQK
ncbi:conserved hypothetical protein [Pediculus humanus corporis]|uniref:N-acetyltransferase domain-containing protein n=1 Tax=Pediculus humanus subsp. corporis TaxID=121224 RepID=E0VIU8_PEDHC|nr:uncharacterized protein Phum_PHUM233560 [Pediculus humanus corporis]EEB13304.1 conserved hypothetical protein [Pediculus humanus corporis]